MPLGDMSESVISTETSGGSSGSQSSRNNIPSDRPYPKLSKATAGYTEVEQFKNSDLHTGYFCYNCEYFLKPNRCAIVKDTGPDVNANESGIIASYGVCAFGSLNEKEAR